jgi:hypothetical protein
MRTWIDSITTKRSRSGVATGLLLGLAFLAHTAAGVFLTLLVAMSTWFALMRSRLGQSSLASRLRPAVLVGVVATVVVLPFVVPLAQTYSFNIINRAPGAWQDTAVPLTLDAVFGDRPYVPIRFALAVCGVVFLIRARQWTTVNLISSSFASALGLLLYCSAASEYGNLVPLVPPYHFFFILRGLAWICLGAGLFALVMFAHRWSARWSIDAIGTTLTLVALVALFPKYLGREAFTTAPAKSRVFESSALPAAREWVRSHTAATDVFLASDVDALIIAGGSGRRVVSVESAFSSPYVDYDARARARDAMFSALLANNDEDFLTLRDRFGVRYVVARGEQATRLQQRARSRLSLAFAAQDVVIFEVLP